ncbi:MAG: hypothetical protein QQN63_12405 [Nitrosopumilus sp.]
MGKKTPNNIIVDRKVYRKINKEKKRLEEEYGGFISINRALRSLLELDIE